MGVSKAQQQLLLSDGPREPPTLATVQATWDVIAPEPPEPHVTQQSFPESEAAREASAVHQHPQAHFGTMHQRSPTGSRTWTKWLEEWIVD